MAPEWKPSRREQRADWWLKRILRSIGAGGVVYTTFVQPSAVQVIVFGALATGLDIGRFVVYLVRSALDEAHKVGELSDTDSQSESKD